MPAHLPFPLIRNRSECFDPKHIALSNNQHVKIGRPKGLTRQYSQVWEDGGKLSIQHVENSNGISGSIRPPGRSSLSFDLIINRLRGELQKSKETGAELHNLMTGLGEIQDIFGGSLDMPPPRLLPPVHPPQAQQLAAAGKQQPSLSLLEIQMRLQDTQSSLASHADKIRSLELSILGEQELESLKQEMRVLRDSLKACEPDLFQLVAERENDTSRKPSSNLEDDEGGENDDAKSVMTVTTGDNLERIDEEDEEHMEHYDITEEISERNLEMDEETHWRREELGRPNGRPRVKTLEPTTSLYHPVYISVHINASMTPIEAVGINLGTTYSLQRLSTAGIEGYGDNRRLERPSNINEPTAAAIAHGPTT
ncbi:hypothetical protein M378DRAFT_17173 [Amanita muscaria Koide BX008]|uniref:Uncharacterized protein n=1 Tax=Amanita muscaria (strain Koide BX008) TaxID=946122 RepID=A0A0C2W593_AMAMK|nr:hypothetical protein M378DRAFT_17173 [Amanita muscaria Koide BX008]